MSEFLLDVLDNVMYAVVLLLGLVPSLIVIAALITFGVIAFRRPDGRD